MANPFPPSTRPESGHPLPVDGESCLRICLTPAKNESWILRPFLEAAAQWADRIVVADQGSTDGSIEILKAAPKVELVINDSTTYDEGARQRLLLTHARKLPGKRILFALDADEALSSNCTNSDEWAKIAAAPAGTVLRFHWVNVLPGFREAWSPPERIACGYVDDGAPHTGQKIHSRRIPWPENAPVLDLHEIVVLHFQYVAWDRVVSKHRWYQVWERLNHPDMGPLDIFRQYHHMYGSWGKDEILSFDAKWIRDFPRGGADFQDLKAEPITWWDKEVVGLLVKHGPQRFRRIALWDQDWNLLASKLGMPATDLSDPRTWLERASHRLLRATQKRRTNWLVRAFEKTLRLMGW